MSRLRNRHRRHSLRVLDRSPSSPPSWSTPNGRCLARTTAAVEGGGGHPPRATSPGAVAFVGGALSAVLLPARVEALPVRRGMCRSRPRTPCRGTDPWRQQRHCGRRDALVSMPVARRHGGELPVGKVGKKVLICLPPVLS